MQKRFKEAGLGLLNLLTVGLVVALLQGTIRKYLSDAGAMVLAVVCLGAYAAAARWIERRNPAELAVNRALPEVAAGLGLGLALFSAVMAILVAVGVYLPTGWGSPNQFDNGLFLALSSGIMEEILFRGLLFRIIAKVVGSWGALLLTSALFGLSHLANPGATFTSSLAIALEAGILLGAAYSATQRLWLPIGLHVGWNLTEGWVFGMTISGHETVTGLLKGSLSGPIPLTGGAFGPEASLVAFLVCLPAALFFVLRMIKLKRVEPPVWSRAAKLVG